MDNIGIMSKTAQEMRISIVDIIHGAGSGHTGGSLSCAEILTVLYDHVMNIKPENPQWEERDRFVLSKGHAAPALYVTLARKGYFDASMLKTLRNIDSPLQGHPCMFKLQGVEMSTGSLGMGISVGVGMALMLKAQGLKSRVYVLCGDGEMNEGQNWEGLISAAKWKLDNLCVIVDRNHVQLDGTEAQVMPMGSMEDKARAFGLNAISCSGHDVKALVTAFEMAGKESGRPTMIVAETVKGKGVSFMEGQSAWHGKVITDEEHTAAVAELKEGLK